MKHLLCIILLLSSMNFWAQDVIINKDGDAIKVWGLEVSNTSIFYRESQASDAPIKRIEKNDVLMIKYQDGRKEVIGESYSVPTSNLRNDVTINTGRANASNSERIAAYNNIDVKWIEVPKAKDDNIFSYCRLKIKEESVLESDEVSISIETGEIGDNGQYSNCSQSIINQLMTFIVHNKTNQTMFLDLGNTFFIRGGESEPYYIPTATSEYGGKTVGSGINLGAVAGALGIGGAAGTLASGINLSESNTNGTQTTIYSQRIVSIPPNGSKTLNPKMFIPKGFCSIPWIAVREKTIESSIEDYKQGNVAHWNETDSPLTFSFFLSFAFDETFITPQKMKVDMYLSDMYAIYGKFRNNALVVYNSAFKSLDGRIENWKKPLHFLMNNISNYWANRYSIGKICTTKSQLGGNWESVAK